MTPQDVVITNIKRYQRLGVLVGVVGLAATVLGFFVDVNQAFQSYLFAFIFWNGLTLGCLGLYLLHNVVGGNWGVAIRRFLEAGARTLPLTFLLILPILIFGIPHIYFWAQPAAQQLERVHFKEGYLNIPFFIARAVIYFLVWAFYAFRLTGLSARQDRGNYMEIWARMKRISPFGLLIFVITATFAYIDWIMSLEPRWFSTIFGAMFLVGQILETFAFTIILLTLFYKFRPFSLVINYQHFHDLGNLMLAFTMLWAYTSLSQFLIIWSGNLPEEIPWYIRRFSGGWGYVAWFIGVFHFCVPFVMLLMRFIKKDPRLLYRVALYMFVVRFIDIFWIVEPAFRQRGLYLSWMDLAAPVGVGGLWVAAFLWRLQERPLLALHDPRLGYHPLETEAELTS
ncbi:MAG: hypothetical protein JO022_04055 [Acidobacteriaceae bacterium]|nr:hypothetical protein [Acidobacteriaceae bacterium]